MDSRVLNLSRVFLEKYGRLDCDSTPGFCECLALRTWSADAFLVMPPEAERLLSHEIHASALKFHEPLGNDHVRGPGAGEIDFQQSLQAPRTARKDRYAGTEIDGFVDIMCDEKDSHAVLVPDVRQEFLHHQACLRIKGAERLVHQHSSWSIYEHPSQANALLHASGELSWIMLGKVQQFDLSENAVHEVTAFLLGNFTSLEAKLDIVPHRLPWK